MELGLSLGGDSNNSASSKPFPFSIINGPDSMRLPGKKSEKDIGNSGLGLGFCMALGTGPNDAAVAENDDGDDEEDDDQTSSEHTRDDPLQFDLLPRAPVPRCWSSENGSSGSSGNVGVPLAAAAAAGRGFDVNRLPPTGGTAAAAAGVEEVSSPNSVASSFQMDFSILRGSGSLIHKRDFGTGPNDVVEGERASSRASDEDENGLNGRKKLRLSKEQSAYLEESFKEHSTLNPKQKLALAEQLNLRPRQVEVWFQNRRARTKLKQTEVDCEYLKRSCETLTEENRRLHKELQELRALKTSNPFYMQLPATTLTMCPSCERVATTSTAPPPPPTSTTTTTTASNPTSTANTATVPSPSIPTTASTATPADSSIPKAIPFPVSIPRFFPLAHSTNHHPHQSAGLANMKPTRQNGPFSPVVIQEYQGL